MNKFFKNLSERWYLDAKEDLFYAFFASINGILGYTFIVHAPAGFDFERVSKMLGFIVAPPLIGKALILSALAYGVIIFIKPMVVYKYILAILASIVTTIFFFLYGIISEIVVSGYIESSILLLIAFISFILGGMEVIRLCQTLARHKK